jgi:hypothetical protein
MIEPLIAYGICALIMGFGIAAVELNIGRSK